MMFAIAVTKSLQIGITAMKHSEAPLMKATLLEQSRTLGARLARLRVARRLRQSDVAVRAGVSRSTAVLIEKGDPGRTLGQVLRYLDAIAPGDLRSFAASLDDGAGRPGASLPVLR